MHVPTRHPVFRAHPQPRSPDALVKKRREQLLLGLALAVLAIPFCYIVYATFCTLFGGSVYTTLRGTNLPESKSNKLHAAQLKQGAGAGGQPRPAPGPTPPAVPAGLQAACPTYRPLPHGQMSDAYRPVIQPVCCGAGVAAGPAPKRSGGCDGLPPLADNAELLTYGGFRVRLPEALQPHALAGIKQQLAEAGVPLLPPAVQDPAQRSRRWAHFPPSTGLTTHYTNVRLERPLPLAAAPPRDACWLGAADGSGAAPLVSTRDVMQKGLRLGLLLDAYALDGPLAARLGGGGGGSWSGRAAAWAAGGARQGGNGTARGRAGESNLAAATFGGAWAGVAQAAALVEPSVNTYLLARLPAKGVQTHQWEAWDEKVFTRVRAADSNRYVCRRLAHPCRMPARHPYLTLRPVEEAYSKAGVSRLAAPGRRGALGGGSAGDLGGLVLWLTHRRQVLAMDVPQATDTPGGPLHVAGEAELQDALKAWLGSHGHGLTLQVLEVDAQAGHLQSDGVTPGWPYGSLAEALRHISSRVVAVVGSSSAVLAAAQWAPVDTPVLQLACSSGGGGANATAAAALDAWLQAAFLGQAPWLVSGHCSLEPAAGSGASLAPALLAVRVEAADLVAAANASLAAWQRPLRPACQPWLGPL